jgi:hypothetical protein
MPRIPFAAPSAYEPVFGADATPAEVMDVIPQADLPDGLRGEGVKAPRMVG